MANVVIWGAGRRAERVWQFLSSFSWMEQLLAEPVCKISAVLDSSMEKQGSCFHGFCVHDPEAYLLKNLSEMLIISIKDCKGIVAIAEEMGRNRGADYILFGDVKNYFFVQCRALLHLLACMPISDTSLADENQKFLKQIYDKKLSQEDTSSLLDMLDGLNRQMEIFLAEHLSVERTDFQEKFMELLAETVLATADSFQTSSLCAIGEWLRKQIGAATMAELQYRDFSEAKIDQVQAWWPGLRRGLAKKRKTIGIFYPNYYGGGIQRVISELIPMYLAHGYQVVFFTTDYTPEKEYDLPKGALRIWMREAHGDSRAASFARCIEEYGIDVFCYHDYLSPRMIFDICLIQYLGVPVLIESHIIFSSFVREFGMHPFLRAYQCADALVTLSQEDAVFWKLNGCRTIAIPNPVCAPIHAVHLDKESIILWMGRINDEQKGILDLPQIFEMVLEEQPDAQLWILGEPEGDRKILDQLQVDFKARGVLSRVTYLGYQPDVEPFWRKAKVFLMTSHYEGFGMVIAESKTYGVPMVLYDLPYLELLQDRKGYRAVPQGDKKGAARELVHILRDSKFQKKLSDEAQDSISAFSQIDFMAMWEEAFRLAEMPRMRSELTPQEKTFQVVQGLLVQELLWKTKQDGTT